MKKTYSEMKKLASFEERLMYLKRINGVGQETLGYNRYMAENFYNSDEWKRMRQFVILRDEGCDLAMRGMNIGGTIFVHHIEPITAEDICHSSENMLDPENLVCVSRETHNAIHYGAKAAEYGVNERKCGDTALW